MSNRKSLGISITQNRLDILIEEQLNSISLEIIDIIDKDDRPAGAEVILKIPI